MNGESRKLNTGGTLEAFHVPALPVQAHPVRLKMYSRRYTRVYTGEGTGLYGYSWGYVGRKLAGAIPGTCSPDGLGFPLLERDRTRTLTRINARMGSLWETLAERYILSRRQMGKGFRVWRSGSPRRAVDSWQVHAFPLFNRFECVSGVFRTSAAPEPFKSGKVPIQGKNAAAEFLNLTPLDIRNRVRSSSPRWRGTARHKRQKFSETRKYQLSKGQLAELEQRFKAEQQRRSRDRAWLAQTVLGRLTPEQSARAHVELWAAAHGKPRAAALIRSQFLTRIRHLARVDLRALRRLLAELIRIRAEAGTFAGYVGQLHAEGFRIYLEETAEQQPRNERVPRPPDLLPLPPSAPLAPPA